MISGQTRNSEVKLYLTPTPKVAQGGNYRWADISELPLVDSTVTLVSVGWRDLVAAGLMSGVEGATDEETLFSTQPCCPASNDPVESRFGPNRGFGLTPGKLLTLE